MALSTEDAARLASLKAAYDKLITGEKVAKVQAYGRVIEYGFGDIARLKSEIDQLEALAANPSGFRRGALRFSVR